MSARREPDWGPITPAQQLRMDEEEAHLEAKRRAARYRSVDAGAEGAQNCARCRHITGFNSEHQRGFCGELRFMVSTWHWSRCFAFEQAST